MVLYPWRQGFTIPAEGNLEVRLENEIVIQRKMGIVGT